MSILEKQWRRLSKEPISDLKQEIAELFKNGMKRPVHIGTDAQKHGKYTDFVTAVVVLDPGHGGVAFYAKTRTPYMKSLQHKLFTEVSLSLEVALALCEIVSAENIQVHVDANTNLKWESGPFHQRLAGMVVAHGFKVLLKPESWAATHVADHAARGKNLTSPMSKRERRRRLRVA
jgi:uncharacterized protein